MNKGFSTTQIRTPLFKKWLSLLLVLTMLLALVPTSVAAVDVNAGSGTVWGSTQTSTGDYAIWSSASVLGYRFSLAKEDGTTVDGSYSYDVFSETNLSSFLGSHKTMLQSENKYSKMELQAFYEDYDFATTKTSSRTPADHVGGTKNPYSKLDSDIGVTLPGTASEMISWCKTESNDSAILSSLWGKTISELRTNNWVIAVEPIYAYKCNGNYFANTVTEIACCSVMNATLYDGYGPQDGEWDGKVTSASDSGLTWKFIANKTHREWPNSLYLEEAALGFDATTEIGSSKWATSRDIVTKGYGIMAITDELFTITPTKTVNLDLAGMLDGTFSNSIAGYGTVDVYINGTKVSTGVTDYNAEHPVGTTYRIATKTNSYKRYNGVYSGSLTGTLSGDTQVVLKYSTATYGVTYDANGGSGSMTASSFNC